MNEPVFLAAVNAIDEGNILSLEQLLLSEPALTQDRLSFPAEGYFSHPYLLWFIADNPIRNDGLPANITDITKLLIKHVHLNAPGTAKEQINYTMELVTTGLLPKKSGKQIQLIDLLIEAGAVPASVHSTLAHGNVEAAEHLLKNGAELTLTAAICLDKNELVQELFNNSSDTEKQTALIAAAFYGNHLRVDSLVKQAVDVNAFIPASSGFHSHATALHQAVSSGSLQCVTILVEANADLNVRDKIYQGSPLDWAVHLQKNETDPYSKKKYAAIESYLRTKI